MSCSSEVLCHEALLQHFLLVLGAFFFLPDSIPHRCFPVCVSSFYLSEPTVLHCFPTFSLFFFFFFLVFTCSDRGWLNFPFFSFQTSFFCLLKHSLRTGGLCSSYFSSLRPDELAGGRQVVWAQSQNNQTVFFAEIVDCSMPASTHYLGCTLWGLPLPSSCF